MSLILSGTDGLSDVDGSASTPAIRGTDTNTGIFFPAADTIAFSEGGVESVRIDSSGNVGIGTSSPDSKLHVKSTVDNTTNGLTLEYDAGTAYKSRMFVRGNDLYISADTGNTGGATLFLNGGTERMRIASDGTISTTIGSTLYGAYSARAWVNFNGTGTVAIRTSRNVSSITDNGTGDYTVNFTTAMPDNEYAIQVASGRNPDGSGGEQVAIDYVDRYATGSCRVVNTQPNSTRFDQPSMFVAIFR